MVGITLRRERGSVERAAPLERPPARGVGTADDAP